MDAREIISKHELELSQIHSMRAKIEARFSEDEGKTWTPGYELSVVKRGDRERVRTRLHGIRVSGHWRQSPQCTETGCTADETRTLAGYDPASPPEVPLSGKDLFNVKGNITAPLPLGPCGHNLPWSRALLLALDGDFSLGELYRKGKAAPSPTFKYDDAADSYVIHLVRRTASLLMMSRCRQPTTS